MLMRAGLFAASLGPVGGAGLAVAGVAVLALGRRAFRPSAAIVAAGGGALGVGLLLELFHPNLPVTPAFALAGAALVLAAIGLVAPTIATVVASASMGLAMGVAATHLVP